MLKSKFAAAVLLLLPAFAADVPQYRVNAQHTGAYEPLAITGQPTLKFATKLDGRVRSTPAVVGTTLIAGSDAGAVYAIDTRSGSIQWSYRTAGRVASSPAVADGLVYVGTPKSVIALRLATGERVWSFEFGPELPIPDAPRLAAAPPGFGTWDFYLSSPCLDNGRVYVGSGDGTLYALDAKAGRRIWGFKTGAPIRTAPAVDAGTVYFGTMGGEFFAVDASTGKERWRFKVEGNPYFPHGGIQSSPAVANGKVIFGSRDYHVYALSAADGRLGWKTEHKDSWVVSGPTIAHGMVYVGSSDGKFVQALDLETGAEKWRQSTGANVFGAVAVAGDVAISADWDGKVVWYDAKTGKQLGGFVFESRINSSPVASGGDIYVGADDDHVYAIGFGQK